jgi:hypothetical protein
MTPTPAVAKPAEPGAVQILARIVAGLGGGWVFTWGVVTLGISGGVAAGVEYDDVRTLMYLLAFLVFLGAFLWAFAAKSVLRVLLVLAGGGAVMTGAAWLITRSLV